MLGKWVRFDNKIPVGGISRAQGLPIPKILGYKKDRYFVATWTREESKTALSPGLRNESAHDDSMT